MWAVQSKHLHAPDEVSGSLSGQLSAPQRCWFLPQEEFGFTSGDPHPESLCRVYSQISRAALTCTLSERMTPCWGISTHTSSIWSKLAGIPSRSLLQRGARGKLQKDYVKCARVGVIDTLIIQLYRGWCLWFWDLMFLLRDKSLDKRD